MFKKLKIRVRLIIYISVLIVLTMTTISLVVFNFSEKKFSEHHKEKLGIINDLKKKRITNFFDHIQESINHVEYHTGLDEELKAVIHIDSDNDTLKAEALKAQAKLKYEFEILEKTFNFHRIMLKDLYGNPLVSTKTNKNFKAIDILLYGSDNGLFKDARNGYQYTDVYHPENKRDDFYITIFAPYFKDEDKKKPIAIISCEVSMNEVYQTVYDTTGLGENGMTVLMKKVSSNVHYVSKPSRTYTKDFLQGKCIPVKDHEFAWQLCTSGKATHNKFKADVEDLAGEDITEIKKIDNVDLVWSYIPNIDWCIMTKMKHKDAINASKYLQVIIILLCIGILFFSVIIITISVDRFLTPIISIRDSMVELASGEFPKKLNYELNDEIQDTTIALNNLTTRLKGSTDFAQHLGKGDLNAEYFGSQNKDVLSRALINMQNSLREIEEQNQRRKWATEGLAIHSELLRKNSDHLELLGEKFISSLVNYIDGVHGAVYSISHIGSSSGLISLEEDSTYYELIGAFAYDLKEDNPKKISNGKGLVGQCAKEKRTIEVKNTPHDYLMITSGLGKANVTYITCIPMIVNTQVMGVVELTNFKPFEPHVISFIETLGENFASAIMTVKLSEQTQETLKEFEETTSSLLEKESELQHRYERALKEIENLKILINKLERNLGNQNR